MKSEIKNILKLSEENYFSDSLYKTQLSQFRLVKILIINWINFIVDLLFLIRFSFNKTFFYIAFLCHEFFDIIATKIKNIELLKKIKNIQYWLEIFYPRVEIILRK